MSAIPQLPGMKDESPDELRARIELQDSIVSQLTDQEYLSIDTPIVQPAELFLRKSGGELASRMYTFDDPSGNKVSLRPEFTASVIRYCIEHLSDLNLPVKIQYSGPVFRYDEKKIYGQFNQIGAEILGSSNTMLDAESVLLASSCLLNVGLYSHNMRIVLGDVGVLQAIFSGMGLSQRAQTFMISGLLKLKNGTTDINLLKNEAISLGLIKSVGHSDENQLLEQDIYDENVLGIIEDLFRDSLSNVFGARSAEDILTRYIYKLRRGDSGNTIDQALEFISNLSRIHGPVKETLPKLQLLITKYDLDKDLLQPVEKILNAIYSSADPMTADSLILDLGLVRGIAYYTGMVFEILDVNSDLILCGGGRYDGLIKALGAEEDVPAMGFAYNVESMVKSLGG
ncbi:MAG: hypothetical protein FI729_06520 [SAR202 cluster bacterium]|nr:hypothetical protein [SAR202 cluster bacterium]|tara:strand:+ start:38083 stop:39279 length:1197 start_codon:yes stop_codon:yes gene_type:complete